VRGCRSSGCDFAGLKRGAVVALCGPVALVFVLWVSSVYLDVVLLVFVCFVLRFLLSLVQSSSPVFLLEFRCPVLSCLRGLCYWA